MKGQAWNIVQSLKHAVCQLLYSFWLISIIFYRMRVSTKMYGNFIDLISHD